MAKANLNVPGNFQRAAFGQDGFKHLTATGTATATGDFVTIQALEETDITVTVEKGDALANVTIPAGMSIYGQFTSITVASGGVLAYIA